MSLCEDIWRPWPLMILDIIDGPWCDYSEQRESKEYNRSWTEVLQFITLNYHAFRFINEFCKFTLLSFQGETSPLLYAFFWVITRRMEFICRRFGTLCLFHLHRQVDVKIEQSVPKRRYINSIRRVITQKKAYNIQNTAKAWNQEYIPVVFNEQ